MNLGYIFGIVLDPNTSYMVVADKELFRIFRIIIIIKFNRISCVKVKQKLSLTRKNIL